MDQKQSSELTKPRLGWIRTITETEKFPAILPKSKTGRLALQAKLANIEAEKSIARAYQIELARAKAIGEAMFKSGRALRYTIASSGRQILLRGTAARRRFEPGFRNREEA